MTLRDAVLDALAVVAPVDCAGCDTPDRALCASCAAALVAEVTRHESGEVGSVWAALRYEGVARHVILAYKEGDRTDARAPLARALAVALDRARESCAPDILVGVPSSRAGARRRGYDPVGSLLARAGQRHARVLVAARDGPAQKSLGVDERRANRAGTLRSREALTGIRVLLVDDVLTTGATLDEAARAVREAGGEVVGAVVLAFTPRRSDSWRSL